MGLEQHTVETCRKHAERPAAYRCKQCQDCLCHRCIQVLSPDGGPAICPACGSRCSVIRQVRQEVKPKSFFQEIPGLWAYPFRGQGKFLILAFFLFMFVLGFATQFLGALVGILGILVLGPAILIGGLMVCYICTFLISIIGCSARGDRQMPDWPNFSHVDDLVRPLVLTIGTILLCFGPAMVYHLVMPLEQGGSRIIWESLLGLGLFYLPMGLLTVTLYDSILAINPITVIGAIVKIPLDYSVVIILWFGLYELMALVALIPHVGPSVSGLLGFYAAIIAPHIVGLMYFANRKRLGWFED